jgi:DNA polymerase III epsilon subunit family exonuclease
MVMEKENNNLSQTLSLKGEGAIYCSLDIETSGFDPLKDEILEVGFVKFQISNFKFQILEEWTQVFKPTKPVEAKILGLTGIKQEELDTAPEFSEFKEEIQNKLQDTIIVGHNVVFDIKFLESRGIKFSGQVIDTLDLVQWLLPTHHSYNLENLMHYFGISHKDAHRALADAKASLEVLKKLLNIYENFSKELKGDIQKVLKPFDFLWKSLLLNAKNEILKETKKAKAKVEKKVKSDLKFESNTIYNFNLGANVTGEVLNALNQAKQKSLVVLPKKSSVIKFWKEGLVEAVWTEEQLFDEKNFEKFLKTKLTADEAKFALKILVWRETNWQHTALVDLNLSFFGGQFKQYISGKSQFKLSEARILACDIFTFLNQQTHPEFRDRQIVFFGLAEFEQAISFNQSDKVSWGQINYALKTIYNPEIGSGEVKHKNLVVELLGASDLFFGLSSALLQTNPPTFLDIAITQDFKNSEAYNKIKMAAENFEAKLTTGNKILGNELLAKAASNLHNFFEEQENRVKWLELSDKRFALNNAPLHIKDLVKKVFKKFPESLFVNNQEPKKAFEYFKERLGLQEWQVKNIKIKSQKKWDLFTSIKKINCHIEAKVPSFEELAALVSSKNLPAAILFAAPKVLKEFHEANYKHLKSYASLLTQNGSGGSNKLFNNFSINNNGLLLATDRLILKSVSNTVENARPHKLSVKTLILLRLPFDPVSHPYAQALSATYPNAFSAMALPKALYNFHQLVDFFYTPDLKNIYLFDSKLSKEYSKPFFDYLAELSGNS